MKIAIISLPQINTPVQGFLTNLNGWWSCPEVLEQWAGAYKVVYDEDIENRESGILTSYHKCIAQFYKENAL
jgi:hypothetical protein